MKKAFIIIISVVIITSGYYLYSTEFWEPKFTYSGKETVVVAEL